MSFLIKENIAFYIFLGAKNIEVLTLQKAGPSNPVKIPLSTVIT
jgi:hypothetical protein